MSIKDRWCRLSFLQGHNLSVLSKRCLTSAKEDKVCPLSRTFYCPTEGWAWPVFRSPSHSCHLTFCSFVLLLLLLQVTPWSSVTVFSFFLSICLCFPLSPIHTHTPPASSFSLDPPPSHSVVFQAVPGSPIGSSYIYSWWGEGEFSIFVALAITPNQKIRDQI